MSFSEGEVILQKILENTPYTGIYDEFPKEEKENESSPKPKEEEYATESKFFSNPSNNLVATPRQEKEVLIAKSQPLQSQDLAIDPKPSIPQNPPRKEEIPPLESSNLSDTDGLDFQFHKRPSSEYNSNPLQKGSLIKCPYSQWEEFEDGMSNDAIEGQPCHMENLICYPIMFIDDTNSRPISKPIPVFEDPPYAHPFYSHDDPRNPLSQPNHRSHEDHKDDQEIL
jgi:hypothetical protein